MKNDEITEKIVPIIDAEDLQHVVTPEAESSVSNLLPEDLPLSEAASPGAEELENLHDQKELAPVEERKSFKEESSTAIGADEDELELAAEEAAPGIDDPLGSVYDLERGELLERAPSHRGHERLPWSSRIQNAKEFFSTEILYRFDILEREDQQLLRGRYRIELKGFKGGIWTIDVGEGLNVVNRREEADIVFTMQQRDFLQLVNGDLNPQLAMLAQKIRIQGDLRQAVAFERILLPIEEN